MAQVSFSQGLYSDYALILVKDPYQLYFCTDTGQIFLGDVEYTAGVKQLSTMSTEGVATGTIVQYVGTTTSSYINGYFYRLGSSGWEAISTEPAQPPIYITWSDYQQLSTAQKNSNRYLITDYPGSPLTVDSSDVTYKNTSVYLALNDLYSKAETDSDNLAPSESTSTASSAHATGSYFINADGDLCRAISDIAVGDTIVPGDPSESGVNCVVTSLGLELQNARTFTIV